MDRKTERIELIKKQAELETALMELYEEFAKEFEFCSLWSKLAEDEKKHASWLKGLVGNVKNGTTDYEKCGFIYEELCSAIESVIEFTNKCRIKDTSISKAFDYARKIESSLFEKEFLTSFETDSEYLKQTLETLIKESKEHRELVDKESEKYMLNS